MRRIFSFMATIGCCLLLAVAAMAQSQTTTTPNIIKPKTTVAPTTTAAPRTQRKMSTPKGKEDIKTTVKDETKPAIKLRKVDERARAAKPKVDDLPGDLSQEQQLKMQTIMDQKGKAEAAASNIMKKEGDTASEIVGNMK